MTHTEIRKKISEQTGCHELLVEEILTIYNEILTKELIEDMSIQMKGIGTISLVPIPPKINTLNNDTNVLDWSYLLAIRAHNSIRPYLKKRVRELPDEVKNKYLEGKAQKKKN